MPPRIIFQHTPKCGGTSVRKALVEAFGAHELLSDVVDRIDSTEPSLFIRDPGGYFRQARTLRPTQAVICGHFPIRKYAHVEGALRATIVRHPVDRTISHYLWLKATPREELFDWRLIRDNDFDVVAYASLPKMTNYYRRYFFADATVDDYDLVIFSERFAHGIERLSQLLGRPLRLHRENVTADITPGIAREARTLREDPEIRSALSETLASEIEWFEKVRRWPIAAWTE